MDPFSIMALIAAAVAAIGGTAGAVGSANAAASQKDAAQQALDFQREMYNQQRSDQAPWLSAGKTSLAQLMHLTQDPSAVADSPAYKFRLAEGQKALERGASARGGLASGGFMKALTRYGQGVASDEYGNQWNRLSSIAGLGQTSANNLGNLGAQYGNNVGNLYGNIGAANAAGSMGIANAFSGGAGTLGGLALYGASRPPIPTQQPYSIGGPRF